MTIEVPKFKKKRIIINKTNLQIKRMYLCT